jgi:hypothetical protein
MNRAINLLFLLLLFNFVNGQEWTEPVVINPTQSQLGSVRPDFCIDNEGHIHCVWSTIHGMNFYRIWYSKSEDGGETWTSLYNVSQNNAKWMAEPQIVSDSLGTLHLVYEDDAGSSSHKIIYKTNDGIDPGIWSESDTLNQGYYGAYRNLLVIDHNDRLYCFWYIDSGYGKMYYRFMDIGLTDWSDVIMPYDTASFYRIVVGSDNSLNIAGSRKHPMEITKRVTFYKLDTFYNWVKPEIVSPQTSTSSPDLSLDAQLYPHIVWMQYSLGNITGIDSSMYSYRNTYGWQPYEFIHSDNVDVSIIVDDSANKHIVEVEKLNDINVLTEYAKTNEQWEASIIEENNAMDHIRLLYKSGIMYLVYVRIDSNDDNNIVFRKKEVLSTAIHNSSEFYPLVKIFPNPSNNEISCSYISEENQYLFVKIYDQKGNEIRLLFEDEILAGEIQITWDGKDRNGEPVGSGIYLLSVETEKNRITKKIIMH